MTQKSVSIFGTRGVPAQHGGFETFAQHLSLYLVQRGWNVTVYCQSSVAMPDDMWHGVKRVHITTEWNGTVLNGPVGTAAFDLKSLLHAHIRENGVWLSLGYNTGALNLLPRVLWGKKQIINMDGVEWRRAKWPLLFKIALYINYWLAGLAGNRLVADHPEIEEMMRNHFYPSKIKMIAYGADTISNADIAHIQKMGLEPSRYAIVIARAEPENSILEIVQAWSKTKRHRTLVVLGNFDPTNEYHRRVKAAASAEVMFPGAIFDRDIVQALRFYAHVYVHGHTVGGTNPSLVEALGAGNAVIAHDNRFNRWVAGRAGMYFHGAADLARLFDVILADDPTLGIMRDFARNRHAEAFQWRHILEQYEMELTNILGAT